MNSLRELVQRLFDDLDSAERYKISENSVDMWGDVNDLIADMKDRANKFYLLTGIEITVNESNEYFHE